MIEYDQAAIRKTGEIAITQSRKRAKEILKSVGSMKTKDTQFGYAKHSNENRSGKDLH